MVRLTKNIAFALALGLSATACKKELKETATIVPKTNVEAGRTENACTPSQFGNNLGHFNNVIAYSNPSGCESETYNFLNGINTGMKWQCVEYPNRYYLHFYGINIRIAGTNAEAYFRTAAQRGLKAYLNGTVELMPGDILVSEQGGGDCGPTTPGIQPCGHVAVVMSVGTSTITVINQNWTATQAIITMSKNGNFVSGFTPSMPIRGILRYEPVVLRDMSPRFSIPVYGSGSQLAVEVSSAPVKPNQQYRLELSDAVGNFNATQVIGISNVNTSAVNRTIVGTLPANFHNTAAMYRIRVSMYENGVFKHITQGSTTTFGIFGTPTVIRNGAMLSTPALRSSNTSLAATYQWFRNGMAVVGGNTPTIYPRERGTYFVRVIFNGFVKQSANIVY
jgi:hypothetical protein